MNSNDGFNSSQWIGEWNNKPVNHWPHVHSYYPKDYLGVETIYVEYDYQKDAQKFDINCLLNGNSIIFTVYVSYHMLSNLSDQESIFMLAKQVYKRSQQFGAANKPTDIEYQITKIVHKAKHPVTFANGGPVKVTADKPKVLVNGTMWIAGDSVPSKIERESKTLPAVQQLVAYPCGCYDNSNVKSPLFDIIIHLNDKEKWTRERIADWIDRLHDDGIINAEFEPWEEDTAPDTLPADWQDVGYTTEGLTNEQD